MGPKKKNVNMDGNSFYEDLNEERDARLARRLQRRSAATIAFKKQNLSVNTVKRTLDHVQNAEESMDTCYAKYCNADVYSEGHSVDDDDDDDDGDNDAEYVMGLKHFREDAKSYILEMTIGVICMIVKYEEENELDDDLKHKSSKSLKDGSCGDKVETEPVWRIIAREEKKEPPTTLGNALSKGRKISVVDKDAKAESRANGRLSQKRDHVAHYKPEIRHDMRSYMVNESYEYFLSCLLKVGDTMIFKTEDGKYLRYEEEEDSSSDSDSLIVLTGNVPSCFKGIPHTPPVTSKTLLLKGSSSRTSSKFREKLMDILRKPFDKKEYKELLVEASHRKPMEGHRRMRNVEKTYLTGKIGKSYLDLYPDLANKIYSVRGTRHRVLYLLRGFFYWLKNLSQEGAFLPWLDESCLKLMQRL